ncbi:helix-turn-helix domain-containing protein [Brevibacillus sp. NRS-1366]|uniref:helix-turn-helix domain-containing protein n=1 Tax=Brevibacillus sp. NRS-1366 TaxID=3233899 RepID=UPI003D1A3480
MQKITLSVNEVAELIDVSTACVYNMVRDKQIPHVRIRGRILFHRDIIEKWLRGELAESKHA